MVYLSTFSRIPRIIFSLISLQLRRPNMISPKFIEVKLNSKHCKSFDRCVVGFDHHSRWLNNCIERKNYTTFILLMVFVLLVLIVEARTVVTIFIRRFADRKGISNELEHKLYVKFPCGVLAAISAAKNARLEKFEIPAFV